MNKRISPPLFAIFEKDPQKNALPNKIIMGPYNSPEEAEENRQKYGFANDNNYVARLGTDYCSPLHTSVVKFNGKSWSK